MTSPRELQALYNQGKNITQVLKEEKGLVQNTDEIIEIAYDLQTGSYIAAMDDPKMASHKAEYSAEIAKVIQSLGDVGSVLEAGVGEATTLCGVLNHLDSEVISFGFDLCWSRVAYAKRWLIKNGKPNTSLCTGNLFNIPFADNSVDFVYTSHSIEPNGGSEKTILQELFRVTRKYLILLEPGYELASDEAKRRMDQHGYCKNISAIALSLGYQVLRHELFPFSANPLNPTAITIIKKDPVNAPVSNFLACPQFHTPLEQIENMLFSEEALVAYPIVGGIPCLRIDNGIFASKYKEMIASPHY
jgi:ubiquinone/menaquinone biosynthesis C-methylase UbiE/uncharacterized protein YbaR (Trm112 family)